MLDILVTLFKAITHSITTIVHIILSIPTYVTFFISLVGYLPTFMVPFIIVGLVACVVINIKRLVI